MSDFRNRLMSRLRPWSDVTMLVLTIPSVAYLYWRDPALVITLGEWTAWGITLTGLSVALSRSVTQLDLSDWAARAKLNSTAAGLVILSAALIFCTIFMGLVLWAKS